MKKVLNNLKDLIMRHKILSMICLLAFIIIIVLIYVFFSIFIGGNNKYGNRLNGIEAVELSKGKLNEVVEKIEKNEEVESAKVRVQGKIVYFDIIFGTSTTSDKAKEIAGKTLDEFDDEDKEFYDFEYILTQNTDDEKNTGFKITGTKGPKTEGISFIKS